MLPISLLLSIFALTTSVVPPTSALPIPSSFRDLALPAFGTIVRRSTSSLSSSSTRPSFDRQYHPQQNVQQRQEQQPFFVQSGSSPNALLGPVLHILDEPLTSSEEAEEIEWSTLITSSAAPSSSPSASTVATEPLALSNDISSQPSSTSSSSLLNLDLIDLDIESIYASVLDLDFNVNHVHRPLPTSSPSASSPSPPKRRHLKPHLNSFSERKPKVLPVKTTMKPKGKRVIAFKAYSDE